MKKLNKKTILLIALAALFLVGVGGTLAYLIDATEPVTNTFKPVTVDTEIEESFNGEAKTSVAIRNDGETSMYVRVALVANWVTTSGEVVGPYTDLSSHLYNNTANETDSNDSIPDGSYWIDGGDGYYYYSVALKPGEKTTNLLKSSISYTKDAATDNNLVVEVIHQSIQSEGITATSAQTAFAELTKAQ